MSEELYKALFEIVNVEITSFKEYKEDAEALADSVNRLFSEDVIGQSLEEILESELAEVFNEEGEETLKPLALPRFYLLELKKTLQDKETLSSEDFRVLLEKTFLDYKQYLAMFQDKERAQQLLQTVGQVILDNKLEAGEIDAACAEIIRHADNMSREGYIKVLREFNINNQLLKEIITKLNSLDKLSYSYQGIKDLIHNTDAKLTNVLDTAGQAEDATTESQLEGNPIDNFILNERFTEAFDSFYNIILKHGTLVDSLLKQNKAGEHAGLFTDFDRQDKHLNIDANVVAYTLISMFLTFIDDLPLPEGAVLTRAERRREGFKEEEFFELEKNLLNYMELWNPVRAHLFNKLSKSMPTSFQKIAETKSRLSNVLKEIFSKEELSDLISNANEAGLGFFDFSPLKMLNRKTSGNLQAAELAVANEFNRPTIQNIVEKFTQAWKLEPTKQAAKQKEAERKQLEKDRRDRMTKAVNS